jgi:hypothetical protein
MRRARWDTLSAERLQPSLVALLSGISSYKGLRSGMEQGSNIPAATLPRQEIMSRGDEGSTPSANK